MEKLDRYFEKCIQDAFKSEEREYKPEKVKWFYIVVEKQILFLIDTPYTRVTRRATYRINSNVWKNFGLYNNGDYFIDTILQPNYVCNKFTVNGNNYYLCKHTYYKEMKQGEVIPCFRYEELCKAYHDVSVEEFREKHDDLDLPSDIDWKDYRDTYFKAFGEYPEVEINHKSKTVSEWQ